MKIKEVLFAFKRWMYRSGSPGRLARVMNRMDARQYGAGLAPGFAATLEVVGRKSGTPILVPIVITEYEGKEYLASMLGDDANWVRNVRAAGGRAVLIHGTRRDVLLEEVPVDQRAPILRAYLQRAVGARPHYPVDKDAPVEEFEAIASDYPAFLVRSV